MESPILYRGQRSSREQSRSVKFTGRHFQLFTSARPLSLCLSYRLFGHPVGVDGASAGPAGRPARGPARSAARPAHAVGVVGVQRLYLLLLGHFLKLCDTSLVIFIGDNTE